MTTTPTHAQPAEAPAAKPRIALWDNARFVLLVLVVVAHAISTVRTDTSLAYGLYIFIYAFHMPALFVLSGMFSKPEASPKLVRGTLQLLFTWLVWEVLWALGEWVFEGRDLPSSFLVSPSWTLWFLVSLATMRIVLPYIALLRHPLIASVGIALVAGALPAIGVDFSASRTLCLLPFFVGGWMLKRDGLPNATWFMHPSRGTRGLAWFVLALAAAVAGVLSFVRTEWRVDHWLLWKYDYFAQFEKAPIGDFAPEGWLAVIASGAGMRILLIGVAATLTLALLLVMPRRHGAATVWGARTLYTYLLHGPIVYVMRATGVVDWFGEFGTVGVVALVAIGVALAVILAMTWITKVFRLIVEPPIDALLMRETASNS